MAADAARDAVTFLPYDALVALAADAGADPYARHAAADAVARCDAMAADATRETVNACTDTLRAIAANPDAEPAARQVASDRLAVMPLSPVQDMTHADIRDMFARAVLAGADAIIGAEVNARAVIERQYAYPADIISDARGIIDRARAIRKDAATGSQDAVRQPASDDTTDSAANVDPRSVATCGTCGAQWDFERDPSPSSQCHWCNGRGYSIAPVREPVKRGAYGHVIDASAAAIAREAAQSFEHDDDYSDAESSSMRAVDILRIAEALAAIGCADDRSWTMAREALTAVAAVAAFTHDGMTLSAHRDKVNALYDACYLDMIEAVAQCADYAQLRDSGQDIGYGADSRPWCDR
jgi:hypothetical protein